MAMLQSNSQVSANLHYRRIFCKESEKSFPEFNVLQDPMQLFDVSILPYFHLYVNVETNFLSFP